MKFIMILSSFTYLIKWWRHFVEWSLNELKHTMKRVLIVGGCALIIMWLSIFMYASFYQVYVPSSLIIRPAYFKFRVCPSGVGMCSFPMANITLSEDGRAEVLGRGQKYHIFLELKVPDSIPNRDLGMFMIMVRMYDRYGTIVQESSRAATLHYQSYMLIVTQMVLLLPLYVLGLMDQTQTLRVSVFESYWDDVYHPAVGALVEIHSRQLQFYSGQLQLYISYTGLRYYIFYWPLTSAVLGIIFNFIWLSLVMLLSWYKLNSQGNMAIIENTDNKEFTFEERHQRVSDVLAKKRADRGSLESRKKPLEELEQGGGDFLEDEDISTVSSEYPQKCASSNAQKAETIGKSGQCADGEETSLLKPYSSVETEDSQW